MNCSEGRREILQSFVNQGKASGLYSECCEKRMEISMQSHCLKVPDKGWEES